MVRGGLQLGEALLDRLDRLHHHVAKRSLESTIALADKLLLNLCRRDVVNTA